MSFSTEPVVSIKETQIFQEDTAVLSDVNFEIQRNEFVYLIGRTGSGKSSLLKTLYADLPLIKGEIKVADHSLKNIKRSVTENLTFVMRATGWKDSVKIKSKIAEVLMRVGLGASSNKMPHQLSGGEQQRIVIARALINEPIILMADEPTGNLDPEVGDEILNLFKEINRSGTAVLMSTHNHQFLDKHPARVIKIENGRIRDSSKEMFSFN